jgi:hypothetical protein
MVSKETAEIAMQKKDNAHKVICYVSKAGLATLRCPECETTKTVDTTAQNYAFKTYRAKCKCGCEMNVQFEYRQYYRKKVKLPGTYQHRESGVQGKILVQDISLMGIGFNCLRKHDFKKGDKLDIKFTLDNRQKSRVSLRVAVLNTKGPFVGAERCDTNISQPDLGFYLR